MKITCLSLQAVTAFNNLEVAPERGARPLPNTYLFDAGLKLDILDSQLQ